VSHPSSGWLKIRYDAEDLQCSMREDAFHFPFLLCLSAGDWWVLISERRGRKISKVSFGVYGLRSATLTLDFFS